ncbi:MAG: hypothetical protein ABI551_08580 [Polyangiaceae bacterium]
MSAATTASRGTSVLLLVFFASACAKKEATTSPATDDESTAPTVFDDGKRALLPLQSEAMSPGGWTPKRIDAERASDGVPAFLKTAAPKIAEKFQGYYGQIWGVTDHGTRKLRLNFSCSKQAFDIDKPGWTQQAIMVDDGGDCFFQVDFDPATSTYSRFRVNGDA